MFASNDSILILLIGFPALMFWIQRKTKWKFFDFFPPLVFIYFIPLILTNTGMFTMDSPVYGEIKHYLLPMVITYLILDVDIKSAFTSMGKLTVLMISASVAMAIGFIISYMIFKRLIHTEDVYKSFTTLSGSFIGGTANLAAAAEAINASAAHRSLAVVADNLIILIWLPILLMCKDWKWIHKFTRANENSGDQFTDRNLGTKSKEPHYTDILYLLFWGILVTWLSDTLATTLGDTAFGHMFGSSTIRVLSTSTIAIILALTPIAKIPGSSALSNSLLYIFIAQMAANSPINLEDLAAAPIFVIAAFVAVVIHGFITLYVARLLKVDVGAVAIASIANLGGAASTPVVASAHNEKLLPAGILMAMIGYALGNYLAIIVGKITSIL